MLASEGVGDPAAWGMLFGSMGPIGLLLVPLCFVLLCVFAFCATLVLLWRGSTRLGIVGFGPEIKAAAERGLSTLDRIADVLDRLDRHGKTPPPSDPQPAEGAPPSAKSARQPMPSRPESRREGPRR